MGTASTKKFIKNNAGVLTEEAALITSAGAGDANALAALNASGLIDDTMMNASAASVANAVVKQTAGGIIAPAVINAKIVSAGAGDSGKIPQLDATGRIDASVLPVGIGADTATITASEALAAGDLVNIYNVAGVANCRKADGSVSGKEAHGFVLAGVASSAAASVYFEGTNTQCTGLTPGVQYLSGTVAGKSSSTPASGAGKVVQVVGFAISATALNFQSESPIVLA
jgi:hypothetical protein